MVLRWLVRNWVGSVARQTVHEAVVQTARQKLAEAAEGADAAQAAEAAAVRERSCDVAVLFALAIEAGGLEDLLAGPVAIRGHGFTVWQGGLKGRHVVVATSGAGRTAAACATEAILAGHQPRWVISAGLAGGLSPRLKRGDVVMADAVVGPGGDRLVIDLKVDPHALEQTPGVHVGPIATVDRIVCRPEEKRALGEKHQALAADTETYAVAEVCRRRQARFLAVRIVSDAADDALPPEIGALLRQTTRTARLGAAVGAVWKRPSSLKDMWKLRENALVASDRLARFLASTIEQLVPLSADCGQDG